MNWTSSISTTVTGRLSCSRRTIAARSSEAESEVASASIPKRDAILPLPKRLSTTLVNTSTWPPFSM
jgi:hypothetical protein